MMNKIAYKRFGINKYTITKYTSSHIIITNPTSRTVRGLHDGVVVSSLQDQAQVMLSQHTRTHYPACPARCDSLPH